MKQLERMGPKVQVYQIVCGCYNTLFLTMDRRVYGQGKLKGQKQVASYMERIPVPHGYTVKEIIAVGDHSFLLTTCGRVLAFGDSTWSQTGLGTEAGTSIYPPRFIDQRHFNYDPVVHVSSGFGHSAFMTRNNDIYTCGANNHSQLGLKMKNFSVEYPTRIELPEGVQKFKKVICGCAFLYVITDKNKVYSCGSNNHGQCAQGVTDEVIPELRLVSALKDREFVNMYCGQYYAIFQEDNNTLWACGKNKYGLLGIDSKVPTVNTPCKVVYTGAPFKWIHAGYTHWLAITLSNEVYGCGMTANGQLACDDAAGYRVPTKLHTLLQNKKINFCAGSFQHSVFYYSPKGM